MHRHSDACFELGLGGGGVGTCRPRYRAQPGRRDGSLSTGLRPQIGKGQRHRNSCEDSDLRTRPSRNLGIRGAPEPPGRVIRHSGAHHATPHGSTIQATVHYPPCHCPTGAGGSVVASVHAPAGLVAQHPAARAARPHGWFWVPAVRVWHHMEPAGGLEVSPGVVRPFHGALVPRTLVPSGWPRMQVTPPNYTVHHPPPPAPPLAHAQRPQFVPAPSVHVPGHYGWSPVLKKHAWIAPHPKTLAFDPKSVAAGPIRDAITGMLAMNLKHTHAQTMWGLGGQRIAMIPGHWSWDKSRGAWYYVEPHADKAGRPTTVRYPVADAPAAAFGARPGHVPPLHFWPDALGNLLNRFGQRPSNAPTSLEIPHHARYARAHGLLDASAALSGFPGMPAPLH